MDLYKYHSKPESLDRYAERDQIVPERILEIAKSGKKLTQRQEDTLTKSPKYAFHYAFHVLNKPWPAGEAAIAKDAEYSYYYAYDVLKKQWPAGEAAIAKSAHFAYRYAHDVIKKPWLAGEAAIANDTHVEYEYAYRYARDVLKLSDKEAKHWGKK